MVIQKAFRFVIAAFIFLGAATYAINSFKMLHEGYQILNTQIKSPSVYETRKIIEESNVKGTIIIQQLYSIWTVNAPIEIDGKLIETNKDITKEHIPSLVEAQAEYKQTIERDTQGKIILIQYTKEGVSIP